MVHTNRALSTYVCALLCSITAATTCQFKKDASYYLSLSEADYISEATNGNRIGDCYIVPRAAFGACDMYVKSAVVGRDGDRGWPKTTSNTGTGCVKAPDKTPRSVKVCFYRSSSYSLTPAEVASFCTERGDANAVAMSKHAVRNNACNLPSNPPTETCTVGDRKCPCGADSDGTSASCPVRGRPVSMPSVIRLDRVRRCRSRFLLCNSVVDNPDYNVFHRLSRRRQKKLFLSQVYKPPREDTRNLVLIVAGQQEEINLGFIRIRLTDESNRLTGQRQGYKRPFKRRDGSRTVSVDRNSLVQSILSTGYFSPGNTFVGLVFDARFQYEYSKSVKDQQEDAYYNYIKNRMSSINTVYLAGHSRGGCLVMRLASRLTREFPNARVIVHNYDGVCTEPNFFARSEFGVGRTTHRNPLRSDYYVYTTRMQDRFRNTNCLSIRSFLTGEKVILNRVRAFGHLGHAGSTTAMQSLTTSSGFIWYSQSFHNIGHNSIDSFFHGTAALHFTNAMQSLPCTCGGT